MPDNISNISPLSGKSDTVCAVVVTYNIGDIFWQTYNALAPQVAKVIIIDNGSTEETLNILEKIAKENPEKVELIHNNLNNLAKAQNIGITKARDEGFDWVLLLDHDSYPEAGMIETMLDTYNRSLDRNRIGIIAPYLDDRNTRKESSYLRRWGILFQRTQFKAGEKCLDNILTVISSGSLIPMRVLDAVGNMDEDFVIDYIDKDFSLRLATKGYRIIVVRDAVLKHRLGECRDHHLLGARITTTNHPPLRRYYIYRNRLKVWGRYVFTVPSFIAFDIVAVLYDLGRITLYEGQKFKKLWYIANGVKDAFWGVRGTKPSEQKSAAGNLIIADTHE